MKLNQKKSIDFSADVEIQGHASVKQPNQPVTVLNSETGLMCCKIKTATDMCRSACKGALFSPSLSDEKKHRRVHMVCNRLDGNGLTGDSAILRCIVSFALAIIIKNLNI